MMSGNAEFRVVLKIWAPAHTTLTAVIVRIGNEKSASVYRWSEVAIAIAASA
jgi:hypothetical protein